MEDAAPLNGAVGPEVGPAGEDQTMAVRRLLDEAAQVSRELGQLAEDMVAQSEVGRREAQRLIAALAEATMAIDGQGGEADSRAAESAPAVKAPFGSDGARMLARQMLADGTDREVVERNLRSSFGIENAEAVVDSILTADR